MKVFTARYIQINSLNIECNCFLNTYDLFQSFNILAIGTLNHTGQNKIFFCFISVCIISDGFEFENNLIARSLCIYRIIHWPSVT